jgi:hypothetical protein
MLYFTDALLPDELPRGTKTLPAKTAAAPKTMAAKPTSTTTAQRKPPTKAGTVQSKAPKAVAKVHVTPSGKPVAATSNSEPHYRPVLSHCTDILFR